MDVHIRNWAVMHIWPREKLRNLYPSMTSSSLSSHNLHLVVVTDLKELDTENDMTFEGHVFNLSLLGTPPACESLVPDSRFASF